MYLHQIYHKEKHTMACKLLIAKHDLQSVKLSPKYVSGANSNFPFWGQLHHVGVRGHTKEYYTFDYRLTEFPGQCGALVVFNLNIIHLKIIIQTAISLCRMFEYNTLMVSHTSNWAGWKYLESIGFKVILTAHNAHSQNNIKFGSLVVG